MIKYRLLLLAHLGGLVGGLDVRSDVLLELLDLHLMPGSLVKYYVYIYIYVYTYIYIYTCIYISSNVYIYLYIYSI